MSIKKILYIILFFTIFNFANAEENLKSVGKYKDWESFVLSQDGNKICFAQSIPVVRAPKKLKRDPSRLFVSFRPAEDIKNEIKKQIQSMPGQQKQVLEYYQKNPSATASLRGSIYEEKIINLIKQKSKQTKKRISLKEAEDIIKGDFQNKKDSKLLVKKDESKKPKKTVKSPQKKKKIRKK